MLQVLREWGDRWAVDTPPLRVTHHGHDLRVGSVCDTCGEPVRGADIEREMTVEGWDRSGPR